MLLKKLEAYGFKSFADKLNLEFGPGITAIVGPNGSGKSNITEAIRWVLGEQSAKNLRGHKMEDVIFIGSERRKPLGIAEVSLTLDNHDNTLPIEFSEVTITRRVFRSGESEFFINKVPCRLKDIYELFSDTGVGREALSVINQNQADEILNSHPEARRVVFEEAAGISKYKNRKREAVRRLEETQQNLLRVRDILSELATQIEPLAEAAAKTEQYLVLDNKFKQLDREVLFYKIQMLTAKAESIQLQCADLEDKLAASSAQLGKYEAEKETAQYTLGKLENQCQESEAQIHKLNLAVQQLESNVMLARERMHNYQDKQQRLRCDIKEYDGKIAGVQQEIEREQAQIELIRGQLSEYRQYVTVKEGLAQEITERITQGAQQVTASKDAVLDRMQLLAQKRNNLHSARTEDEMGRRTLDKLSREADENQAALDQIMKQQKACADRRVAEQKLLCEKDAVLQDKRQEDDLLTEQQRLIGSQGGEIQKKMQDLRSRHKVLLDMQKAFEGYSLGVKAIMSTRGASWSKNVCGIVADLLQVPAEYAMAVEVALGNALQNIVTEDAQTAKAAIAFLKHANQGRATLLPLDTIKAAPVRDDEIKAAKSAGALGFAVDLVSFDLKYKAVMQFLLGRIIIARNMDAALGIARKAGFRTRIVTLEGDIISPGGAMTGGSHTKKGSGLLSRKGELQDLQRAITAVRREEEDNRAQLLMITKQREELAVQEQALQEARQQLQIEIAGREKEHLQLTQEQNRLEKMHQVILTEMDVQHRIIDEVQQKISQVSSEISALETADREIQEAIQFHQQDVVQQQLVLQQVTDEVTATKIRLATIEQEEITAGRMIERLLKIKTAHQDEKQAKGREIAEIEQALAQLALEVDNGQKTGAELVLQQDQQNNTLRQYKDRRYQIAADVSVLEKNGRELRRGNQDLQSKLHELQMARTQYTYEFDTHSKYLTENYGLAWEEHKHAYMLELAVDEAEETLAGWRDELKAMGPVNLAAIEEHERVCERFHFLNQQAEDLDQAQAALHQVITEIDSTMRKQFIGAFQAIGREFTVVFGELFGGGHAELQFTNKEDVLETGIDIIAQPPGKKLQKLSLLSGGERALTVISLLFAMLRVKPTPFCVVDEIDAALDEANVSRFAQFLGRLSKNSQFIVITHRKGTMEYANVLHGITMEEQGVSKMISVKFMEQAG